MTATALGGARAAAFRSTFVTDAVSTASPAALLVMLYDRLALDLARAEEAQRAGDRPAANMQLLHAQDIVSELLGTLDVDAWEGGPGLAAVYAWLLRELIGANVAGDAARTAACRSMAETLRDAWRQAATAVPGTTP